MSSSITKIPVIIADIGGTNARLSIVRMTSILNDTPEVIHEDTLVTYKHKSLMSILKTYLAQFKETDNYPKVAVIGVTGPVEDNAVIISDCFPELDYTPGELFGQELGIKDFTFLNDFGVNGYGVQTNLIEGVDYFHLNSNNKPTENGIKTLFGAGTGLGMAFLVKAPGQEYYDVYPSEACYSDFPFRNEKQERFMKFAIKQLKKPHLNTEDSCCGTNLNIIYSFLNEEEKIKGDEDFLKQVIKAKDNRDEMIKLNKLIINKGMSGECPLCRATIDFFIEIYGQITGNYAVTFLSTGGVYLFGGMSSVLEPYIRSNSIFFDNFVNKGSMKSVLEKIPIIIVKNTNLGVKGAFEYARRILAKKYQ